MKIEFIYSTRTYSIKKIRNPKLFALETNRVFNILGYQNLIADKLTTIGPNTIGIPYSREDEQYKQIYDVITLFLSNKEKFISSVKDIKCKYIKVAKEECKIHDIEYDLVKLFEDMIDFIKKIENIEKNKHMYQIANNFQALYLRGSTRRDKTAWAIVGYQLELIASFVFKGNLKIKDILNIELLINRLKFKEISGPERGAKLKEARAALKVEFSDIDNLSSDLFKRKHERIIWELIVKTSFVKVKKALNY